MSLYDTFLFNTKDGGENFSIAGLQINSTLNIRMKALIKKEETKIIEAKFKAKSQTILETNTSGDFYNCCMTIEADLLWLYRKMK